MKVALKKIEMVPVRHKSPGDSIQQHQRDEQPRGKASGSAASRAGEAGARPVRQRGTQVGSPGRPRPRQRAPRCGDSWSGLCKPEQSRWAEYCIRNRVLQVNYRWSIRNWRPSWCC